ncbi:MAG TPA: hypothetical protein DEP84_13455 [Chloroflexi bacterium]|nr:hypothetical protein [Chloroflexota bacterium]
MASVLSLILGQRLRSAWRKARRLDIARSLPAAPSARTWVSAGQRSVALTPIIWPSLAFLFTALVGVWVAYNRAGAWARFGLIALGIALALGLAVVVRWGGERALGVIGVGCALLAAGVGSDFLLVREPMVTGGEAFAPLRWIGLWFHAYRAAIPLAENIHRNAAAGALAILLPLGAAGLLWARAQHSSAVTSICTLALVPALVALILTSSWGAWVGLSAGVIVAGLLNWRGYAPLRRQSSRWTPPKRLDCALFSAAVLLLLGGFWVAVTFPAVEDTLRAAGAGQSVIGRIEIWRQMLTLVRDYPLTGSGLGSTVMVYSTYVLLLQVAYFFHAHNLFLQVAVEQGVPGLAAFLWLVAASGRLLARAEPGGLQGSIFRAAGLASLVALLVHGMADAELYASPLVPVTFVPIGTALAIHSLRMKRYDPSPAFQLASAASIRQRALGPILWLTAGLLAVGLWLLPRSRAIFEANAGAVAQTRAELSVYRRPKWPIQDALRRSPAVNLDPAIARYDAALALDPANVTANQRLGQIEIARGQYERARRHLEAAYASGPDRAETRQMLGEVYAVTGQIPRAAALWRTVHGNQRQLGLRQWWYLHLGERTLVARIAEAAALARGSQQGPCGSSRWQNGMTIASTRVRGAASPIWNSAAGCRQGVEQ